MKFICAQHVAFKPPGNLIRWASEQGDMTEHCAGELAEGGEHVESTETMRQSLAKLGDEPYRLLSRILDRWRSG